MSQIRFPCAPCTLCHHLNDSQLLPHLRTVKQSIYPSQTGSTVSDSLQLKESESFEYFYGDKEDLLPLVPPPSAHITPLAPEYIHSSPITVLAASQFQSPYAPYSQPLVSCAPDLSCFLEFPLNLNILLNP